MIIPQQVAAAAAKSLQSCPTLCDPIDGSPPGSTVPGILQPRTLEWVAISFSNAWKWKVKGKLLSHVRLFATPWTTAYQAPPSMGFSRQEYWSGVPLPSPSYPTKEGEKKPETLVKFTVQRHRFTESLRPSPWTIECLPSPHTSPSQYQRSIYSNSYHSVGHTWLSGKKLQGIPKGKKVQFQETEQASEPDTAGMLKLSDQESTRINIRL